MIRKGRVSKLQQKNYEGSILVFKMPNSTQLDNSTKSKIYVNAKSNIVIFVVTSSSRVLQLRVANTVC